MGYLYYQQKKFALALPILKHVTQNSVFDFSCHLQLILTYSELNNLEEASMTINKTLTHSLSIKETNLINTLQTLNNLKIR